jgi:hypothetical protein
MPHCIKPNQIAPDAYDTKELALEEISKKINELVDKVNDLARLLNI